MAALPLEGVRDAPVVYIDGYQGVSVGNGIVKMNLFQDVFDTATNKNIRKCVTVLAIPLAVFEGMRGSMNDLARQFSESGLLIVQEPGRKPQ
jgi:hypothetical protein